MQLGRACGGHARDIVGQQCHGQHHGDDHADRIPAIGVQEPNYQTDFDAYQERADRQPNRHNPPGH